MNFRGKQWKRFSNHIRLDGTSITILQWNTGKNANFMVEAGYKASDYIQKTIPGKGQEARDNAINFALSIADKYKLEELEKHGGTADER